MKFLALLILVFIASCTKSNADECGDFIKVPFETSYICVSPDYYMVDDIRMPLSLPDAQRIAKEHNAILPTPAMVDAIWRYADIKLQPSPLPAGPQMTTMAYFIRHNAIIEDQLKGMATNGKLIAGHKKDLVQPSRAGRVAIYGWHYPSGGYIQPLSHVHGAEYKDYSHGLRLIRLP